MGSFSVKLRELHDGASAMRNAADEFVAHPALKYCLDADQVGDSELGTALTEFQRSATGAIEELLADTKEVFTRLNDTAVTYHRVDTASGEIFTSSHRTR